MSTSNVKLVKLAIGIAGVAAVAGLAGHFSDPGPEKAEALTGAASSSELRNRYAEVNPDIPPAVFASPQGEGSNWIGRGDDDEDEEYEHERGEHEGREHGGALFAAPGIGAGQQDGPAVQSRRRTRTRRS